MVVAFAALTAARSLARAARQLQWFDNKEAAAMLKVSPRTLQNWRDEGLIGFSQVDRKIYYSRADIGLLLQNHYNKPFKAAA
ncbi:helix-turn-helix domain-containing protein [Hymenobacter sp. CRA2]|uniref:helix-turn-helix domain-containing protein n=1 Tax=Hymenobacter sp. CRA2 TaxID=1955620 RepID=UPI002936EDE4|nr:helix-turn-helix domain-containing protein [Hymenobacter sp. CRA2]